ncbi:MAG: Unknown protein, partial [uncultured Sulfurovum sp.]
FDACLMGMFEIAYQLRNQTNVMVASQHLEPAKGWDYERILNELDTSKQANDIAEQLISFHDEHHTNEKRDVTKSAIDTEIIEDVAEALDRFAEVLRASLKEGDEEANRKELEITLSNSQFFHRKDYVDLIDFVEKVKSRLAIEAVEPHAQKLLESVREMVIANHTIGYYMEDANGLSIYFPKYRPFEEIFTMYEKLDFVAACPNWVKLLKWYILGLK